MQYTYIHKNSQTNCLIKVQYYYPILQKKTTNMIKTKEKEKKIRFVTYNKISYTKPT